MFTLSRLNNNMRAVILALPVIGRPRATVRTLQGWAGSVVMVQRFRT